MLTVRLRDDYVGSEQRIGPIEHVTITGAELTLPGHGAAIYRDGRWVWNAASFLSLETDAPSCIQLKSELHRPMLHGPFDSVRIIGSLIHVCRPERQPFARLNTKSGLWHIYSDWSTWPEIVIFAAGANSAVGGKPSDD